MLTPHCSAASGMVAPLSIAATTRLRKSSEYGFAIHAGLLPAGSLNHIRAAMGIPDSAFPGNALTLDRLRRRKAKIFKSERLHMKVYWSSRKGCVICSANASGSALGGSSQKEAGV